MHKGSVRVQRRNCSSVQTTATFLQLLSLRTGKEAFQTDKALVVGISSDPVEKQKDFVEKQKLTVRQLCATPDSPAHCAPSTLF